MGWFICFLFLGLVLIVIAKTLVYLICHGETPTDVGISPKTEVRWQSYKERREYQRIGWRYLVI